MVAMPYQVTSKGGTICPDSSQICVRLKVDERLCMKYRRGSQDSMHVVVKMCVNSLHYGKTIKSACQSK